MKLKRILSLGMALVMAATFLDSGRLSTVAHAADTYDIQLSYVNGDEGDPTTASILVGDSTTMKITKSDGFTEADPPFTVLDPNEQDASDMVKIQQNESNTRDITVTDPNGKIKDKTTLSIKGNFYALLAEGEAFETTLGTSGSTWTTVKALSQDAIMSYSEVTIVCTQRETADTPPVFEMVPGSFTGSFTRFEGGEISAQKRDPKNPNVVTFKISKGNNTADFELTPSRSYSYQTDDEGNDIIDDDSNKIPEPVNTYIRKGTKYRLVFRLPTSNSLLLNVLTPKYATEQIAAEIERNDGVLTNSFIELGKDDDLQFITQSFKLKSYTRQYNADFDVTWEWKPDQADWEDVLVIAESGTPWRQVSIFPLEYDVTGTLKATVTYRPKFGSSDVPVFTETKERKILIRGTGTPAEVTQYSMTIGQSNTTIFSGNDTKLPSQRNMDVYDGSVPEFDQPTMPHEYKILMRMGANNASSQYAIVTANEGDNTNAVTLMTSSASAGGTGQIYTLGDKIENPKANAPSEQGEVLLTVVAREPGTVHLNFKFYVKGNNNSIIESPVQPKITINVRDTSPHDDANLKDIVIKDEDGKQIDFGFSPGTLTYDITLPYSTESVTFKPTRNDPQANKWIVTTASYRDDNNVEYPKDPFGDGYQLESGKTSPKMELIANTPTKVTMTVTAQNPTVQNKYIFNIMREPPSDDATLKSLALYSEDDSELKTNLIQGFDPLTKEYRLEVPYKTQELRVRAEQNHPGATVTFEPELTAKGVFGAREWFKLSDAKPDADGIITFTVTVKPESDTAPSSVYKVYIRRLDPSEDSSVSALQITDKDEKNLTYTPAFKSDVTDYRLQIPYSTGEIRLKVTPSDENVESIVVLYDGGKKSAELKPGTLSKGIPVRAMSPTLAYDEIIIRVTAEAGKGFETEYVLQVERAEPSDDATLKSLVINDQDGQAVKNFAFNPDTLDYTVEVPYETSKVSFTPTVNHEGATIVIAETSALISIPSKVASGSTSKQYKLNYSDSSNRTDFEIRVTPEDGLEEHMLVYSIHFVRGAPSSDARLKGLTVDGDIDEEFNPVFVSNKTHYTAMVAEGATGVTITATANHPYATIKIDGNLVESGTPSEQIDIIEVEQDVEIVVTAQDGVTTMTYTITFTNENLITKSSNADLKRLTVNYGQMTPKFQASVTEYEVATTEDTYSVDIIPIPADRMAEIQVFAGTKEIGDYDGNYAQAIQDGENPFTVRVTSPDGTVTKDYTINVYRNEEDKMKNLAVLQAEDVDFENSGDVIEVMISEYPRVSADVFNELKNYPEKTIVFQGNDYSLSFKAKDLTRVVPQTEIYDFRMSFTSPNEDDIMDLVHKRDGNDDIDDRIVMVHFEGHGPLPGPATFSISLGHKYRNDTLYWHYYNEERERIDYYGKVKTNSKGTFAVTLDHLSTYLVSPKHRILGSENKEGMTDEDIVLNEEEDRNKYNPSTGQRGEEE